MNNRPPNDLGDYLLLVLAAIAVAVLTAFPDTGDALPADSMPALCATDSECALPCPPDDAECDGGPND